MADELENGVSCILVNCGMINDINTIPLYRLYNPETSDHLYTLDDNERLTCVNNGWQYEGVAALLPAAQNESMGSSLWRLGHPEGNAHVFTNQAPERDNLVKNGWRWESTFYGASRLPGSNHVPMFGRRSPGNDGNAGFTQFVWTCDGHEANALSSFGWSSFANWITAKPHLVADVRWNGGLNSPMQVWPGNNTDAQIFILRKDGTKWMFQKRIETRGYISRNSLHNHYFDVFLQPAGPNSRWTITKAGNQKFRFLNHDYQAYYIHNDNYFLEVMDNGNGIPQAGKELTACRSATMTPTANDHKWLIIPTKVASGVFSIHPLVNDGKLSHRLDIEGPGVSNVKVWSASNSQGQLWVPIKMPSKGQDMYAIRNLSNGGYLDVPGDTAQVGNGANVHVYPTYDGKSETWHLVGFGRRNVDGIDAPVYRLGMMGTTREYALDVSGGSSAIGANVQTWEMNGSDAQLFAFVPRDANDPTVPVPSNIGLSRDWTKFSNQKFQRTPFYNEDGVMHAFPCWTCTDAWFGDVGVGSNTKNENGYEVSYRTRYYNNKTNKWDNWGNWTKWDPAQTTSQGNNSIARPESMYVPFYKRSDYRNEEVQFRVRCIGSSSDYTGLVHGAYGEATLNFIAAPFYIFGTDTTEEQIICDPNVVAYTLENRVVEVLSMDIYTFVDGLPTTPYDLKPLYTVDNKTFTFSNQKDAFIGDGTTTDFTATFDAASIVDVSYGSITDTITEAETVPSYTYSLSNTPTEIESVLVNSTSIIDPAHYHISESQLVIDAWPVVDSYIVVYALARIPTETKPLDGVDYFVSDPNGNYLRIYNNSYTRWSKVSNPTEEDMSDYRIFETGFYALGVIKIPLSHSIAFDTCEVYIEDRLCVEGEEYTISHVDDVYTIDIPYNYRPRSYQEVRVLYHTNTCTTENTTLSVAYLTDYDITPTIVDGRTFRFDPAIPDGMTANVEYIFSPPQGAVIDIRYKTDEQPQTTITLDGLAIPYTNDLEGSSNLYITDMSIMKDGKSHKVLNLEQPFTGLGRNGIISVKFNDFINYLDGESVTFKYQVGNDQHNRWTDLTQEATLDLDTSAGTLDIWPGTGPMLEQGPRHTGIIFMPKDANLRCGMAYKSKVFELPRWEAFDKTVDGVEYSAFALPYSFRDESTRVIGQRSNSNGAFGIESAEIDLRIFDQERVHSWITTDGNIVCIDCREGDYLQSDRSMQKNNTALDLSGREHQTVIFGDTNQSSFTVEGSIIYSEDYRNTDSNLEDIDSLLGTHTIYRDPYGHVVYAAVTDVSYQTHHDYATVSISMIEETR